MAGATPGLSPIRDPSWHRIGRIDQVGRRSLWTRMTRDGQGRQVLELAAGREGDDAYARIDEGNPAFRAIEDVICTAIFAAAYEHESFDVLESEQLAKRDRLKWWFLEEQDVALMQWADDGGCA